MMVSKQDRAKLIKEFERRNSFGNKNALVRIRSRYTIAVWIPQQQNWMAGDGHAPTPEGAVQCADYDTLMLFKTQKETMFKAYLFGGMK